MDAGTRICRTWCASLILFSLVLCFVYIPSLQIRASNSTSFLLPSITCTHVDAPVTPVLPHLSLSECISTLFQFKHKALNPTYKPKST